MKKRQFLQFYQDRRMGGILILILLTLLGVGIYSYSQRVNESSDPVLPAEQKVDAPPEVLELDYQPSTGKARRCLRQDDRAKSY